MRISRTNANRQYHGSKTISFISILVILGAVVYLMGSAAVGSFLSEKLVSPIMQKFFPEKSDHIVFPEPEEELTFPEPSAEAEEVFSAITEKPTLTIPEDKLYLLYTKKGSDENEIRIAAEDAAKKGGAGYIYRENNENYAVLASYLSEDDAKSVMEKLPDMALGIKELSCPALSFSVDAGEEAFIILREAAEKLPLWPKKFYELAVLFDKGEYDMEKIMEELKNMEKEAEPYYLKLSLFGDDPAVLAIKTYIETVLAECRKLSNEENTVLLSSGLKYACTASFDAKLSALTPLL